MGAKSIVKSNARHGTRINITGPAIDMIGKENLEPWIEALEIVMWSAGAERSYVSRKGSNLQVTYIFHDGNVERSTLNIRDRPSAAKVKA